MSRKPYPSDVSDDEWAFVAPYLTLMTEDAPQREHSLREVFNGLRWIVRAALQSTPESGGRAAYDGAKRREGGKTHIVVDTPGNLPALRVTSADEQDRAQVGDLADRVQQVTGENVELAFVDQGYTGTVAAEESQAYAIRLEVVKLAEAKKGFILLPRRWVVERTFGWAARFRRLARDYERLPDTLAGLHFLTFAVLMLKRFVEVMAHSS
ncbi:MAG: transposase [Acidobacteria bacterium]|nr:transposase [Acidobacteriota bacterium]